MLKVFITVDTEIWCNGWTDLDRCFPEAFRRYVYGPTAQGDYALPAQFAVLAEHGLTASFFVEPLFSARFGLDPLAELVGLIREAGHEVQLHVHPEWVDEAGGAILPAVGRKIPRLSDCTFAQQCELIAYGLDRLAAAGADRDAINAFRAGGFAANADTLRAVAANGLAIDTSYNPASSVGVADMAPGTLLTQAAALEGITEYPVTVFRDAGRYGMRHLQLGACSFAELKHCLESAWRSGWEAVVLVSHNFELLSPDKQRTDRIVRRRFERLCAYLAANRERYEVRGFAGLEPRPLQVQPPPIASWGGRKAGRVFEQGLRRLLYR